MNRTTLTAMLRRHEGVRNKPYTDTVGKLTIGVGRNLDDDGISDDEVAYLLNNDINEVWKECSAKLSGYGFNALNDVRQHALLDLCFNLGIDGLLKFQKMLAAISKQDWQAASDDLLDSLAAKQEPNRIQEDARMLLEGV